MIGVFDSGFGGLLIYRALTEALPQADFIYLGDNGNAPYGTRPQLDVLTLTCVGVERLFAAGCRLVIIACNTASTVALPWIQQMWLPNQGRPDGAARNVIGIVVPTIEAALATAAGGTVAVFATDRTVSTGMYPAELKKRAPDLNVYQKACSGLVQLIEDGAPEDLLRATVHRHVGALLQEMNGSIPDRVILGCTHYALVADLFKEVLPPNTPVIDQRAATAAATVAYISRHPEYPIGTGGARQFWLTGAPPEPAMIERFWGAPLAFDPLK